MKAYIFLFAIASSIAASSQDSISYRIIFTGDNSNNILRHASDKILQQRTMVFYLGESKYLEGKTKSGSNEEREAKKNLRSQYELLTAKGAGVYFVSAGAGWNRISMGVPGERAASPTHSADSLFTVSPFNTCPDPVEINLTPELTAIVFNSEWWLFPSEIPVSNDSCTCKTRSEVLASLDELRHKNKEKMILLVSQHP